MRMCVGRKRGSERERERENMSVQMKSDLRQAKDYTLEKVDLI